MVFAGIKKPQERIDLITYINCFVHRNDENKGTDGGSV